MSSSKTMAIARLFGACTEWTALYRSQEQVETKDLRKRMSELSGEITRLENQAGVRSREIRQVARSLGWMDE